MNVTKDVLDWIDNVIIGQNICPFAKDRWSPEFYDLSICKELDLNESSLSFFYDELSSFKNQVAQKVHSKIIIYPYLNQGCDFPRFYEFCNLGVDYVDSMKWSEQIQVVCFHPSFQFAGADVDELGNYANRAPYPLIHLLSFSEVGEVLERFGQNIGQKVSNNNRIFLERLTFDDFTANIGRYIDGFWPIRK